MTGESTFWYVRPVMYFVIIFYQNSNWKRRIYRKNKYHINMRLITICDWVDCCACSSAFFASASGALFFSSWSLISFTKPFGFFWVYNVHANNWIWFQILLVLTSILEKLSDNSSKRIPLEYVYSTHHFSDVNLQ